MRIVIMASHKIEIVYEYIISYKECHDGLAPSLREIGTACGIKSLSNVKYHLSRLEDEGRIEVNFRMPRMIKVIGGEWRLPNESHL